ncbi:MAG TPA: hypothetical protein VF468_01785 [Actinomycetota bacterium]|nr:hypothetical protein [Actinomycetota bacterium]
MTTLGERFVRALAAKDFSSATGDQIGWMRGTCPGFRPTAPG